MKLSAIILASLLIGCGTETTTTTTTVVPVEEEVEPTIIETYSAFVDGFSAPCTDGSTAEYDPEGLNLMVEYGDNNEILIYNSDLTEDQYYEGIYQPESGEFRANQRYEWEDPDLGTIHRHAYIHGFFTGNGWDGELQLTITARDLDFHKCSGSTTFTGDLMETEEITK